MYSGIPATHADREQFRDLFRNREKTRHGFERPAHEIRIEAGELDAGAHNRIAKKLSLVNADHFGASRNFVENLAAGLNQPRCNFQP